MNTSTNLRLLSLLCLSTPLFAQGAEQDLRIAAKKGTTVWMIQEAKQEQSIDLGGQQMEMGGSTMHTLQFTIKDVDDKGNLVVETKILRVHGSMTMPMMGDVDFDSAKKSEEGEDEDGMGMGMMTKTLTAVAGKTFIAKVDPYGKITSLEGVADLLKDAPKGGMGGMGQGVTEATFRTFVESAFGVLPSKPMAQGGSWEHVDTEASSRGPVRSKMQLTLAKVDADSFEVTATGTVEKADDKKDKKDGDEEGDEAQQPMREMMKSMKIANGKVSGSQHISRKDGFVMDAKNVMTMDMTMNSPMGGGEMSVNSKMTTTIKRTTAEAAMPKAEMPKKAEAAKPDGGK